MSGEALLWRKVDGDDMAIEVNLDAPLAQPFNDTTLEWTMTHGLSGWVRVERKGEKLFVVGLEIVRTLTAEQWEELAQGHHEKLQEILQREGKIALHPNISDALIDRENTYLIPRSWTDSVTSNPPHVVSWAVGYRCLDGSVYVRYACRSTHHFQWSKDCSWIRIGPSAAVLVS